MNIILITTGGRPDLLKQSLESLCQNAADWSKHTLTLVLDTPEQLDGFGLPGISTYIVNVNRAGASASRNIGASSIPKYRRQEHVCFLDDDVYACPKWDEKLEDLAKAYPRAIVSGHAHPFNQDEPAIALGFPPCRIPLLISTVNMVMPWSLWDDVDFFVEPGGPGGSEDYDYCMRAKAKGYRFAVTDPHCIVHCGLTSSRGQQIVGYDLVMAKNKELVKNYGLEGKVVFG